MRKSVTSCPEVQAGATTRLQAWTRVIICLEICLGAATHMGVEFEIRITWTSLQETMDESEEVSRHILVLILPWTIVPVLAMTIPVFLAPQVPRLESQLLYWASIRAPITVAQMAAFTW